MTEILLTHPVVVVVRGLPGSGKSYLADKITRKVDPARVILLDPDTTDYGGKSYQEYSKKIAEEGVDLKLHPYRYLRSQAYDAIAENKIIIWNQPFSDPAIFKKMVKRLYDRAKQCDTTLSVLVVEVEIDPSVARQRIEERKRSGGHGPSEQIMKRFERDWSSFKDLGFEVLTVNGEADVTESVKNVLNRIKEYNLPMI